MNLEFYWELTSIIFIFNFIVLLLLIYLIFTKNPSDKKIELLILKDENCPACKIWLNILENLSVNNNYFKIEILDIADFDPEDFKNIKSLSLPTLLIKNEFNEYKKINLYTLSKKILNNN